MCTYGALEEERARHAREPLHGSGAEHAVLVVVAQREGQPLPWHAERVLADVELLDLLRHK